MESQPHLARLRSSGRLAGQAWLPAARAPSGSDVRRKLSGRRSAVLPDRPRVEPERRRERALLGWPPTSTFHKYKSGDRRAVVRYADAVRSSSASTKRCRCSTRSGVRRPVGPVPNSHRSSAGARRSRLWPTAPSTRSSRSGGSSMAGADNPASRESTGGVPAASCQPVTHRRSVRSRRVAWRRRRDHRARRLDQRPALRRARDSHEHPARRVGGGPRHGERHHGAVLSSRGRRRAVLREGRGAWYAGRSLETALAESIHHRTKELQGGRTLRHARVEVRLPRRLPPPFTTSGAATGDSRHYTIRTTTGRRNRSGRRLFDAGSNGVIYRSIRHPGGDCMVCYRPRLVLNVRAAAHYEYRWEGNRSLGCGVCRSGLSGKRPYLVG